MNRPVRLRKTRLLLVAIILLALLLLRWLSSDDRPRLGPPPNATTHTVKRVVDGDTLLLDDRTRVRLLGVDTPETVKPDYPVEPWGPEATEFTRQFVGDRRVRLEFGHRRQDEFGRSLAFVWVGEQLLNEELIRAGLSPAVTYSLRSAQMKQRLAAAQAEAKAARRGIWSGGARP